MSKNTVALTKSVGSFKVTIPSKVEVQFLIDNSDDFVEATLVSLYRRHVANKGISNGKGFNKATVKNGTRLGRWLDLRGHFTSGEGTRSSKSRDEHLAIARDVLKRHVDQIITMMVEAKEEKLSNKTQPKQTIAKLHPEIQAMVAERTAEVLALLNQNQNQESNKDLYDDEEVPPTVREPKFSRTTDYVVVG